MSFIKIPNGGTTAAAPTKQILTSGTGATYTTPANARLLKVTVVGGGGGGGGAAANVDAAHASAAGGGSGGGTAIKWIANPSATYTYTVGTGGAGGAAGANNGADGVDSVFNTTVIGGKGIKGDGGATQTGAIDAVAKAGGTASGGDINVSGGVGGPGIVFASAAFTNAQGFSGLGGTSSYGGGGAAIYTAGDGGAGGIYGSGGGGAAAAGQYNANAYAGGAGAAGIIIVEEFY